MITKIFNFFEPKKEYGVIFLRLVVGWRLAAGQWGNIINWDNMLEVRDFFQQLGLPAPMISAHLSVYAQFICGILFILGLWIRPAAAVMVFNFIIAIVFYDSHNSLAKAFPAWAILASSLLFLFHGAGKISVDERKK